MKAWLMQHRAACRGALAHFAAAPARSLANILVLAASLFLPFAGLIALDHLQPISTRMAVQPEISVFLHPEASRDVAKALEPRIRAVAGQAGPGAKLAFVPREEALATLQTRAGLSEALSTLQANPLPDAYVITLTNLDASLDKPRADALVRALSALPSVDAVQLDDQWLRRLGALLRLGRQLLLAMAVAVSVVVVAVTFNTIRLQILLQQEEIRAARLVGATDSFIRRPFYYAGALTGWASGAAALAVIAVVMRFLNGAVGDLARAYGSDVALRMPDAAMLLGMTGISALLGVLGAALSVRKALTALA